MFKNLLYFVSLLVVSTYVRALESGIYRIENAVTHDVLLCSPDGQVRPLRSPVYPLATFWKVQAIEGEPDIFTVSPSVQDNKFISFADDNGHPGNVVVVTPGDPYYLALQWRISGSDEDVFWIENRRFRYTQDLRNQRIVAQAADRESPNQLWRFVLVNWAMAEYQDSIEVSISLEPGYYRIKHLIEDNPALVAGIDRKGNVPDADVVIRPDNPHIPQVQWIIRSSKNNGRVFSIVNSFFYGMSLGFNRYTGKVEGTRAEQDNPTQLWTFERLDSLVDSEEETSQEGTLARVEGPVLRLVF
ncbi:hypothetical protein IW261DRAFT_1638696 [Armillaria novae-zelandiae]|uniref:Ricin B lectin domain-containing protein n=1 Tax=Armillaria novae-zelandiae TaxID=153914 RepID=A0AA39UI69_9AGAR|nr:hypothetical protein IW261DRAFT_1638696 [Armillaria novae-zelandiae]